MCMRWLGCLPLALVLAGPVAAGEKKDPAAPTVVVRVRSLDALIDNFKLVAGLVGKEEVARQIHGIIKTKIGPKGLEGIDTSRPLGAYSRISDNFNELAGVALVPISDEKTFLTLLENFNLNPTKNAQGVYTVTIKPVDVHFRFAHKYVYISALSAEALATGKLVPPEQIFAAGQTAMFSASLRLDQIPHVAKQLALSNLEEKLQEASKKIPNETPVQRALREEGQKEFLRRFTLLLNQGREIAVEVDLQAKTKELVAKLTMTPTPGTELAKMVAEVGQAKSVFGGIKGEQAVINGRVHVMMPQAVAKVLEKALKEETAKAVAGITDADKRKQAEALLESLAANFRSGEIDTIVQLNAQGKHFNLLAGIKLEDGDRLGTLVHNLAVELLKDAPEAERAKVKLNAESAGAVNIHRIDVQQAFDAKARELFGDNPLYLAFRPDALLVAVGEGGLDLLKAAATAPPAVTPAVQMELSVARLAPLLAKTDDQRAAVSKLFTGDSQGRVRLTVEGGSSLRVQFASDLSVVQFFSAFTPLGQKRGP